MKFIPAFPVSMIKEILLVLMEQILLKRKTGIIFLEKDTVITVTVLDENKEVIELNQDKALMQGRKIFTEKNIEVWKKPLSGGNEKAIAILNRGDEEKVFTLDAEKTGITKKNKMRDLWLHKDLGKMGKEKTFTIPAHGIGVLKIS